MQQPLRPLVPAQKDQALPAQRDLLGACPAVGQERWTSAQGCMEARCCRWLQGPAAASLVAALQLPGLVPQQAGTGPQGAIALPSAAAQQQRMLPLGLVRPPAAPGRALPPCQAAAAARSLASSHALAAAQRLAPAPAAAQLQGCGCCRAGPGRPGAALPSRLQVLGCRLPLAGGRGRLLAWPPGRAAAVVAPAHSLGQPVGW